MRIRRLLKTVPAVTTLVLLCADALIAQEESPLRYTTNNTAFVEAAGKEAQTNQDFWAQPGVVADLKNKTVYVYAEGLGMTRHDPIEFGLIGPKSSHDYEALARSFADPLDVHTALEKTGMAPGQAVDYSRLMLWPRGSRVDITITRHAEENPFWHADESALPLQHYLFDAEQNQPLADGGFVFTGSQMITPGSGPAEYAASWRDPYSIVSTYNEEETVMDVPWAAVQSEVYGTIKAHPDNLLSLHELVVFRFTPSDTHLKTLDVDITLGNESVRASWATNQTTFENVAYLCDHLTEMLRSGTVPYLNIALEENITIANLIPSLREIESITDGDGVRINPPLDGHLFYKAFLPEEAWRDRQQRPGQPWELHLARKNNDLSGTLYQLNETWDTNQNKFVVHEIAHPVDSPAQVTETVAESTGQIRVMLIYADMYITYNELLYYALPAQTVCPTLYIFSKQH